MIKKYFFVEDGITKNNRVGLLAAGVIFTAIRLVGDLILFIINKYNLENLLLWNSVTTVIIAGSFIVSVLLESLKRTNVDSLNLSVDYLKELNRIFLFSIGILFAGFFAEATTVTNRIPANMFTLLIQVAYSLFMLATTILLFHFLYKWFNLRIHKRTRFYLYIMAYIYVFLLIKEYIQFQLGLDVLMLNEISIIAFLGIVILSWMLNSKTNWVSSLPRDMKVKLLWLSFFTVIISIVLIVRVADTNEFNSIILRYFPFTRNLLIVTYLILATSMLRLFFLILASLPTSTIVERKTSELSSLTYLNKLIADASENSNDNLFDVVTKLALQACNASSSWTEIYENGTIRIAKSINVNESAIQAAHSDIQLGAIFSQFHKSELIDSTLDNKYFTSLRHFLPNVKSLIILPLYSSTERVGTLLVGDSEEYSFEADDLKVLNAFADNIRIALENAKLVKDSIEKERYKNELLVAQKIQSKLLPTVLPEIDNYSIAAYSLPATEVGGDYYDIVQLKNGNYCILVGDVSGKGFSAAFYMAQLKGIVMSVSKSANSPSDLLRKINKILYGNIEKKLYITMSALTIDDTNGNISFARAGHMPFFMRLSNKIKTYIPKGIGLGLADESKFDNMLEEIKLKLNENDAVLMFTDGLNELQSDNKAEFGYDPLKNALIESTHQAVEITSNIVEKVNEYGGNISHNDDMTIFAIIFNGNEKLME